MLELFFLRVVLCDIWFDVPFLDWGTGSVIRFVIVAV